MLQPVRPIRVIFYGDFDRCQAVLGVAKSKLRLLDARVSRSPGVQQGWQRPITLPTGEVIRLESSFGSGKIEIYSSREVYEQPPELKQEERECLCNCNMSLGLVVARTLSGTADTVYQTIGTNLSPFYIYDVAICQSAKFYAGFTEIIGTDFTPWEPGQQVVVMAYHDFLFGCCLPEPLGEGFEQFVALGCAGIVDRDHLFDPSKPELGTDMDDHDWRTTYRILPLCALPFNLWEVK